MTHDELKTAIEHDVARRWPEIARLPDYAAARSLMRDSIAETMEAGDMMFQHPREVSVVVAKLGAAIAKLEAAREALAPKESKP